MKDDSLDKFQCDNEFCVDRKPFKSKTALVLHLSRVHGIDVDPTKVGRQGDPAKAKPKKVEPDPPDRHVLAVEIHGHVVKDGQRYPAVLRRTGHLEARMNFWADWEPTDLLFYPDLNGGVDSPSSTH